MNAPISIPENIKYIAAFGADWVRSVLRKKVDLDFLERNRRRVAGGVAEMGPVISAPLLDVYFEQGGEGLAAGAEEIVLDLFRNSAFAPAVAKILGEAELVTGDLRWRTENKKGRPVIRGNRGRDLATLGGLAHELGHVLFELSVRSEDLVSLQVFSESCAMSLEHWVVSQAISGEVLASWLEYQRKVDRLNEAFHQMESSSALTLPSERHLLPLRETFYTACGYQAIYREASLKRREMLAQRPDSAAAVVSEAIRRFAHSF